MVALNCAMPFWVVEASLIVMVLPAVLALAMVKVPVKLLRLVTAVVKQAPKLKAPEPLVLRH